MRLKTKMMVSILSLLFITFTLGGNFLIHLSFRNMLSQEKERAAQSYEVILQMVGTINQLDTGIVSMSANDIFTTMKDQGILRDCDISLQELDRTLFISGNDEMFEHISKAGTAGEGYGEIITSKEGIYYYRITSYITYGNKLLSLQGVYNINAAYQNRQTQITLYRCAFIMIMVIGAILTHLMSVWLTDPLKNLSVVSKKIAEGNYELRANISSRDEIGELASDFNKMADQLVHEIQSIENAMKNQDEFIGSFAHELKSPMTTIIGYIGMLRMEGLTAEEQQEAYQYIYSETKRLQNLSGKLLALFTIGKETCQFEKVSMQRMVAEVVKSFQPVLKKENIEIGYCCEEGSISGEPDLIKSLLVNLIDNAQKAISDGGIIEISGQVCPDGYEICCKDSGRGIPEKEIEKITEAFYRVDKSRSRNQGGAGLGLALCKKIVELHCGNMTFQSVPGQGTNVCVKLKGDKVDE